MIKKNKIRVTIPGNPVAKKRPRFARTKNGVRTYSCQETDEGKFLLELRRQVLAPIDGPVCVDMTFLLRRPKGHYGSGKNASMLKPSSPTLPTSKPDLDNMEKFVADCCNGVLWRDDAQVVQSTTRKRYATTADGPMTIIEAWGEAGEIR